MHARPRALPRNQCCPKRLRPVFKRYHRRRLQPITAHKKTLGAVKSMAAAEAWDAALPMAPLWGLGSVAAWPLPLLSQ